MIKKIFVAVFIVLFPFISKSQSWTDLDKGANWFIIALYADTAQDLLFAGGDFSNIGAINTYDIAAWNGQGWQGLGSGICDNGNNVYTIGSYHDTLIVGGAFNLYTCDSMKYLLEYYNNEWFPFGHPNKGVGVVTDHNDNLYVGGIFDSIGGIQAKCLAKWNGQSWATVGDLPDNASEVGKILFFHDTLYIAGILNDTAGFSCNFASYDGIKWRYYHILHGPFSGGYPAVVYHNELYLIGLFSKSQGNAGNCIMKLNGNTWEDVGGGITSATPYAQLTDAYVYHDKLYVVGIFDSAGSVPAHNIACWDGQKWCGLGSVIDNKIQAITSFRDTLYIAGGFRAIDGDTMNYVAKWLGGDYVDTCSFSVGISEIKQSSFDFSIYPNPANSQIQIILSNNNQSQQVKIINTLGQLIKQQNFSSNQISIDISDLPAGVYFLELQNEKEKVVKKFVKQ